MSAKKEEKEDKSVKNESKFPTYVAEGASTRYDRGSIQRVTGFDVIFPYFAREQAYLPDIARILHGAREALLAASMVSQI